AVPDRTRQGGGPVAYPELQGGKTARARRKDDLARFGPEREPAAIDFQDEAFFHLLDFLLHVVVQAGVVRLGHDPGFLDLLERRDLGHVDQVAQLDGVGRDADAGVLADAEIAEWVRGTRGRGQGSAQDDEAGPGQKPGESGDSSARRPPTAGHGHCAGPPSALSARSAMFAWST